MKATLQENRQSAEALFLAAERFEEKRQFRKAFRCLLRAASMGDNGSQLNLGNFYASGIGVSKSLAKAEYWYKAAYRRGNVTAVRNLAIDRAAAGNTRSAEVWFKKAIRKKDGGSHVALARLYLDRRGGRVKAVRLLKRVSKLSHTDANELDKEQAKALLSELPVSPAKCFLHLRGALASKKREAEKQSQVTDRA